MSDQSPESRLAEFAASTAHSDLPEQVCHQARRSLINIVGTTLAGSAEPAIEIAYAAFAPLSAGGSCTLIGRGEMSDPATAAQLNAMSANIHDFDDTHEATVIHPAAIPFAACLAQSQCSPATGRDFLTAFALGCETACRIGNAVSPSHYVRGWHITATCGAFGAAAAVGRLLGLSPTAMREAFATAAVQTGGLVRGARHHGQERRRGRRGPHAGLLSARLRSRRA